MIYLITSVNKRPNVFLLTMPLTVQLGVGRRTFDTYKWAVYHLKNNNVSRK